MSPPTSLGKRRSHWVHTYSSQLRPFKNHRWPSWTPVLSKRPEKLTDDAPHITTGVVYLFLLRNRIFFVCIKIYPNMHLIDKYLSQQSFLRTRTRSSRTDSCHTCTGTGSRDSQTNVYPIYRRSIYRKCSAMHWRQAATAVQWRNHPLIQQADKSGPRKQPGLFNWSQTAITEMDATLDEAPTK